MEVTKCIQSTRETAIWTFFISWKYCNITCFFCSSLTFPQWLLVRTRSCSCWKFRSIIEHNQFYLKVYIAVKSANVWGHQMNVFVHTDYSVTYKLGSLCMYVHPSTSMCKSVSILLYVHTHASTLLTLCLSFGSLVFSDIFACGQRLVSVVNSWTFWDYSHLLNMTKAFSHLN